MACPWWLEYLRRGNSCKPSFDLFNLRWWGELPFDCMTHPDVLKWHGSKFRMWQEERQIQVLVPVLVPPGHHASCFTSLNLSFLTCSLIPIIITMRKYRNNDMPKIKGYLKTESWLCSYTTHLLECIHLINVYLREKELLIITLLSQSWDNRTICFKPGHFRESGCS
jgi:hypothetical protein